MATFNGPNVIDPVMAGEYGNASRAHGKITYVAATNGAIGSINRACVIPGGSKITGFREAHAALSSAGGAVNVAWGWSYVDGSSGGSATALLAATDNDAAGGTVATALVPFVVEKDIYVYSTVSVEAAVGDQHCIVDYTYRGTK